MISAQFSWLSALIFLPVFGGIWTSLMPDRSAKAARTVAVITSLLSLGLVMLLAARFQVDGSGMQFVERWAWIPSLKVDYFLGIDGLGLIMLGLSALIVPFAMAACWSIEKDAPLLFGMLLLLEAGLFGAFTALNFFHWFIFWELSLVPAYFLIKLWGGEKRVAAATHFFVYAMVGSVAMLLAFLAIYLCVGTFDFLELAEKGRAGEIASALSVRMTWFETFKTQEGLALCVFLLAFLGFAIKVPLFPFHTWQPEAYAEAPSGVTMVLTGAMSKLGIYGFLRILMPIFPSEMRSVIDPLLWITVVSILYSAFAALGQKDLKRMFAYSSMNHLGYCSLGILAAMKVTTGDSKSGVDQAAALNGVLVQMFNHGVTASALFCFLGFMEKRSGGLRGIDDFGGLRKAAPVYCGLMGLAVFASLGLPGLSGFAGEFLIFKGAYALAWQQASMATVGLLITAIFLLTILQKVFSGPLQDKWETWTDLNTRERLLVVPATALIIALGVWPQALVSWTGPTVTQWVSRLQF